MTSWNFNIYVFNHNGTGFLNSDGLFATAAVEIYASPAVGDLDHDGTLEVIAVDSSNNVYAWRPIDGPDGDTLADGFLNPNGFFAQVGSGGRSIIDNPQSSPGAADLAGDGLLEVILETANNGVFAWHSVDNDDSGGADLVSGWPQTTQGAVIASVAVADIDKRKDGLEIVAVTLSGTPPSNTDGKVYVWHKDGSLVSGWPADNDTNPNNGMDSSPVVGDIDGDGEMEIVVGAYDGRLYAFNHDGTPVVGWPILVNTDYPIEFTSPVLTDLYQDGKVDVVIGSNAKELYVYGLGKPYNSDNIPWGKFRKDLANSASYNRVPIFEDDFKQGSPCVYDPTKVCFDLSKWTTSDRAYPLTSVGKAHFEGDGTVFRSDGIASRKRFHRLKNMIFLYEGITFGHENNRYGANLSGGRWPYYPSESSPARRIILSAPADEDYEDPGGNGPEPPRFSLWREIGVPSDPNHLVETVAESNAFKADGTPNLYYSSNFPSQVPELGTRYSMVYKWFGDYLDSNPDRLEVYLFETDKGITSVGGPIYIWDNSNKGPSQSVWNDWDPRLGSGIYDAYGEAELEYVAVYREADSILQQNVPTITGFQLPSGQVVHPLDLPVYNPGQLVQFTVQGTFIPGPDDDASADTPSNPIKVFTWAQRQDNTPFYGGFLSGNFTMTAPDPCDSDLHEYYFEVLLLSRSGLKDDWRFPIRVQGQGSCATGYQPSTRRLK